MFKVELRKINRDFTESVEEIILRKSYDEAFDVYDELTENNTKDYVVEISENKICRRGYGKK